MPALQSVDYDPFAQKPPPRSSGPRLTPVDHNPFAQPDPAGAALADVPGARITSTFRSAEHNRKVGGVPDSFHLKGEAVDFVPPKGMTYTQAIAAIRAQDPNPRELLDEGTHIHYVPGRVPRLEPVEHDPFAAAAAPRQKGASPASKPQSPAFTTGETVRPAQGFWSDVAGELRHGFEEDIKEGAQPQNAGNPVGSLVTGFDALQRLISAVTVPAQRGTQEVGDPRKKGQEEATAIASVLPIPGAEEAEGLVRGAKSIFRPSEPLEFEKVGGIGAGERVAPVSTAPLRYRPRPPYRGSFGGERGATGDAARLATRSLPHPVQLTPVDGDPFSGGPGPSRRSLPAKVELPPRTNIVGDEAKPSTRTANALYRLQGSNISDKIELGRARAELRKAHGPQSEDLYHALEEPLAKPDTEVPKDLAATKAALDPYLKEQTDIINRLRTRKDPSLDPFLEDQGYVHRIRSDQPDILDAGDQGGPRSPFQSRKSLVKTAASQKARKFVALEDTETGARTVVDTSKDRTYAELKPGMEFRPPGEGPAGAAPRVFKVTQPTTKEIEASSDVRYKKDAIDNTIANVFQLRRVERNLDVLEQTLQDMKERGVAHQEEVRFKGPEGENRVEHTKGEVPKGFRVIPDVPQLKGWVFDHNDAQVQELLDWLPKHDAPWVEKLERLNSFMLRSNFLSPFVHPKNIAEFWGISRGWDWLHPEGYDRLTRTLPEAWREVVTMGPKYRQYLREGSALLSADARTQDFNAFLTDTAARQVIEDPKGFATLKEAFGGAISTPARLYRQVQEASHKLMWMLGDTMMMQRVIELQEKGLPIRDAIRKAEDVIPNYRVPAQIMDSPTGGRMLNQVFANNRFFSIGRYHYNRLAAWGRMFKKIAKGTPEEKVEAAGQFVAMAIIGAIVYPALDKAFQIATGNKNARLTRGGMLSLPDAAGRVASGQEGVAQAIAQVIDLSPASRLGASVITNKDWKGDDILSKFKSPSENIGSALDVPLSQFGPAQAGIEALTPEYGPSRVAGRQIGLELPENPPGAVKGSTAKMLRRKYRKKGQKDPLTRGLQSLGVP